jgi:HNH endonuclease
MSSPYRKRKINGRTYYEHRLVVEKRLGRKLTRAEHVHHKNEQKKDNADENLEVKTAKDHGRHHFAKNPIVKICETCGRFFEPPQAHRKRDRACSMRCRDVLIMKARLGVERFMALDVVDIRTSHAARWSARGLGQRYGVSHHTIRRIVAWPQALAEAIAAQLAAARKAVA